MRQKLTNNFWALYKNMDCAFPLTFTKINTHKTFAFINSVQQ